MRRLPVFFVLDCSESMIGENLKKMEDGLQMIVRALRTDPHALETVYISVIAFAGMAKTIAPLVEVVSFYPPKLPVGGGTSLGAALRALMMEIDKSVAKTTPDRKGDWKPIVYLITDGKPTDEVDEAISEWTAKYAKKCTLIAVALGAYADLTVLKRLTETVLVYEESAEGDFKKFVNWVTASVVAQSKSVGEGVDANTLPLFDESVLKIVKQPPSTRADQDCVTLVGRCQKTRKPYLMKYDRVSQDVATRDFAVKATHFDIAGCYPIDEEYFAWSDPSVTDLKVNTDELKGIPGCPHCGAISAFALCSCGKLLCVNGPGEAICPWCETKLSFQAGSVEQGGFDVGRGRG